MLQENNMSIAELLNYGYPYYKSIPIYNEVLNQVFEKKDMEKLTKIAHQIQIKLKNDYRFPKSLVDEFIKKGNFFAITYNEKKSRRELTFDYAEFVYTVASKFSKYNYTEQLIQVTGSIKQVKNLAIKKFRELKGNTVFDDTYDVVCRAIKMNSSNKLNNHENDPCDLIVSSLNRLYRDIYVYDMYNVSDFFERCDKEKLLFHFMVYGINNCNHFKLDKGLIYTIFKYCREKGNDADVAITYTGYGENSVKPTKLNYKYKDFMYSLQQYLLEHPEDEMSELNMDSSNMTIQEFNDTLNEFKEKIKGKYRVVEDVEFLPSEPTGITHSGKGVNHPTGASLIALKKKTLYALNENQIYKKFQGKKKLKGYTAMLLKNGYVILEINDIKNDKIVTKSGAAYVMPLPLFNKLCECSRTQLRDYKQNNPTSRLEIIQHRSNWEERIQNIIDMNTGISIGEESKVLVKK